MIVGCIGLYEERVDQALIGIKRLLPYVDRYVVIVDESVTEEQRRHLQELGCEVYVFPWEDSMVKMRNHYLEQVETGDWVIVHDPDEYFNEDFCKNVKEVVRRAEVQGIDLLHINSHDTTFQEDGTRESHVSNFFKNLIYKKKEGTHYEGVGQIKEVHECLIIPSLMRSANLSKEKFWYEHVKYWWEVWERAARNVFLAGGGNNVGGNNHAWRPLRQLCVELGLLRWPQARQYFREGNIDVRLKEWLWENRFDGFDFEHEMMEFGKWYFQYLHHEEAVYPDGRVWEPVTEREKGSEQEVMHYVESVYMRVFGRHADQEGKEHYTKAIVSGEIEREDLPNIFRESPEYKERFRTV